MKATYSVSIQLALIITLVASLTALSVRLHATLVKTGLRSP